MIDLIYTDAHGEDQGILNAYQLDLAYGIDENDFELTLPGGMLLEEKSRVYIEGTEWGGIVRGGRESVVDANCTYVATGETWHGMLASTYACFAGEYLSLRGEANEAIRTMIDVAQLQEAFDVSSEDSGIDIEYEFPSMENMYEGLCDMLSQAGAKLRIVKVQARNPMLSAAPKGIYVDTDELNKYGYELTWDTPVNHLICVDAGDEEGEREILHLYADSEGVVSETQTLFGIDERQLVYEGGANEELRESGEKKLNELQQVSTFELVLPNNAAFDIGDVVGVVSEKTGVSITSTVTKAIVKIGQDGRAEVTNEIGEISADAMQIGSR